MTCGASSIENRGTKGLVLKNDKLIREVNRSYYCAGAYDYPIALTELSDAMVAVVHCPDEYKKLEIEDAETGERLTARNGKARNREASDYFHSRLEISPGGRYLVSAGWIWHPWCTARVFDLERALREPTILDSEGNFPWSWPNELDSTTFSGRDRLIVASIPNGQAGAPPPSRFELGIWDLAAGDWITRNPFLEPVGTVFASGDWAFGIYDHPKLIRIATGEIVQKWPHIPTGTQQGPIDLSEPHPPLVAFDPTNFRLAVATPSGITVLSLP